MSTAATHVWDAPCEAQEVLCERKKHTTVIRLFEKLSSNVAIKSVQENRVYGDFRSKKTSYNHPRQ